jgi:3-oxoacyl-[acyl-carrier protein] reductase
VDLGITGRVVVVAGGDARTREACTARIAAEGADVREVALEPAAAADVGDADAVVVVVGGGPVRSLLEVHDAEELRDHWRDVTSTVELYRAALPGMVARRWGRFVAVVGSGAKALQDDADDVDGLVGLGLLGLHKSAVADVAQHGVTLNAVLRHRGADPHDVAAAVAFLLSDGAAYLQGTTIALDGATSPVVF